MSVLQTVNHPIVSQQNRKDLEEDFLGSSYQSMFSSRTEKDSATPTLYGSMKQPHPSYIPNMTNNLSNMSGGLTSGGLASGFQGLSLHSSSATRGGMSNSTTPFGRSNTAPSGYSNMTGMPSGMGGVSSMTGMGTGGGVSSFGAPSPPPQRNNMFINNINPLGSQGLMGMSKQHPPTSRSSVLASAINSGLPINSYGGLGAGAGGVPSAGRSNHGFGSPLSDIPGGQQPGFDPSEFPMLGTRAQHDQVFNTRQLGGGKGPSESAQEFQMRVEDFPSLPGTSTSSKTSGGESNDPHQQATTPSVQPELPVHSSSSSNPVSSTTENRGSLSYDPAPGANKERSMAATKQASRKTLSVPAGMVQDHYGMMGLLTFIKGAETDPNLVALALGSDLTTLGLNLNSPESLYSTFSSPFADSPSRPQDIDYVVPQEYLIHSYIRDKLAPIRLSKYNEDLLFYLYYTSGGDLLQLLAAHELYSRDWRYHKEDKIWITRAPGMRPTKVETTHEEGTYCYFDVNTWRKCHKDLKVEYEKLSEKPLIPPAFTTQHIVSSVPPSAVQPVVTVSGVNTA